MITALILAFDNMNIRCFQTEKRSHCHTRAEGWLGLHTSYSGQTSTTRRVVVKLQLGFRGATEPLRFLRTIP